MTLTDAERAAMDAIVDAYWGGRTDACNVSLVECIWLAAKAHYTSQARPPLDFTSALAVAQSVFDQYAVDQRKWWKRMDGTPILNDVAVRMAQAFLYAAPASAPAPAASNHKRDCRILSTERLDPGQRYCDCGYEAQMPRTYVAAEAGSGAAPDAEPDTSQQWDQLSGAQAFHLIERHADDWTETDRMMNAWRDAALTALRARVAELEWELAELEDAKRDAILSVSNALSGLIERDALAAQVERLKTVLFQIGDIVAGGHSDAMDDIKAALWSARPLVMAQSPDAAGAGEG